MAALEGGKGTRDEGPKSRRGQQRAGRTSTEMHPNWLALCTGGPK